MLIQRQAVKQKTKNELIPFKYKRNQLTTCTTPSQNLSQSSEFVTILACSGRVQGNTLVL